MEDEIYVMDGVIVNPNRLHPQQPSPVKYTRTETLTNTKQPTTADIDKALERFAIYEAALDYYSRLDELAGVSNKIADRALQRGDAQLSKLKCELAYLEANDHPEDTDGKVYRNRLRQRIKEMEG